MSTVPHGLGLYCERGDSIGAPLATAKLVERLRRARARHVGLCVEAIDGWRPPRAALAPVVQRLASAQVSVHVYILPGRDRARLGARPVHEALTLCQGLPIAGYILDAEESYRGLLDALRAARAALVDGATEATSVGITTYGLPTEAGDFPWAAIIGHGWLGWQAYERAASAKKVRRGLEVLREASGSSAVIPHVASYTRKAIPTGELADGAQRLLADLRRACRDDQGRVDVPGAWVWSEGSLDGAELDALASWVAAAGW